MKNCKCRILNPDLNSGTVKGCKPRGSHTHIKNESIEAVHVSIFHPYLQIDHFHIFFYLLPPTHPFQVFTLSPILFVLAFFTAAVSRSASVSPLVSRSKNDMLLRVSPSVSMTTLSDVRGSVADWFSSKRGPVVRLPMGGRAGASVTMASVTPRTLTGVFFEPFEEVKKELALVPEALNMSLARQVYSNDAESAINEQIK